MPELAFHMDEHVLKTDCAHLVQVVVHCDELALQQLAPGGGRAGGHVADIPDDGAVELVALQTTEMWLHAHPVQSHLARQQVRWKQSSRRREGDAHNCKLDSRGERLVGGLSPWHQVAARHIKSGLQAASCS